MTHHLASLDRTLPPVEGDLLLPKPPGVIRQFWYRHPRLTDSLVAASYAVPNVVIAVVFAFFPDIPDDTELVWLRVLLPIIGAGVLMFRRSHPWIVISASWALALIAAPFSSAADPLLIGYAVYALAVYVSVRAGWLGFGISVLVASVSVIVVYAAPRAREVPDGSDFWVEGIGSVAFLLLVVLIGINIGNRRRYVVALVDRAAQLARERDQQAQLSAAAERSRIAREMHDIVSHGLTVMVTLAEGAAATTATSPDRATEAMRQVAESGRNALADMRRMLGVLGSDGSAEFTPQPGIAELGGLIDRFRGAGLDVEFSSSGTPPTDSGEQLTVYRLVQESLTNALRHSADAGAVAVRVRYTDDDTTIDVTNDGPVVRAAATQRDAPGHGIDGMRQRVALYGGTVESGPRAGGGWAVSATLRHEASRTTTTEEDPA